ncbi:YncE family protein [Ramlibacter sp.]|uniref:YncE family protein n=1 Tax=Ramlibacter sp. TaxID=1917967 RepID=UPI002FC7083A
MLITSGSQCRSLVAAAAMLATLGGGLAAPAGTVFTANERDDSITRLQLDTGAMQTTRIEFSPHNVQVTPGGKFLLAVGVSAHSGHGGDAGTRGRLLAWDLTTAGSKPVLTDAGDHPAHVVADGTGTRAFVTDSGADMVHVFAIPSLRKLGSVPTDRYPHGLRSSPDGRTLYVANMKGGTVSVIDAAALKETARIPVGRGPVQVGFSADGKQAYVSLSSENKLGIIDTTARRLVRKVPVGPTPIQMVATAGTGLVYVANQGSTPKPADTVSVVDAARGRVVATVRTGKGAHGVAMSQDGRYVFVTNIEAGTLSVIETASRQVVATHTVGAGPNGVTWMLPP